MSEEQVKIKRQRRVKKVEPEPGPEKEKVKHENIDISTIEIRSEEVQEIMGYIPHWIIRQGITLFFTVIMVFVVGSYFFKYPDVIQSTIVVTTETPPAAIVSRTTGKIQELFAQNNQKINAGTAIAIIENAANYHHVFELKKKLDALQSLPSHFDDTGSVQVDLVYSLGELQPSFSVFLKSYQDYRHFIRLDYHNKKIESTRLQIERYKLLYNQTERQTQLMEQEFNLSKQQYDRAIQLYKDEIISINEIDNAKSVFLQKEYALESARSNMANQKIQLAQLEQTMMDLNQDYTEQKKQLELTLSSAYENLMGQLAQWEQNYLLKTPISGTVVFTKYWSSNQNVRAGDTVVTVIPDNAGKMLGKVVLPIQGSGKVKEGQKVNIKFLNYPHTDYGIVQGIIKSKSLITTDNNYIVEVALPDGLKTSYKKDLPFNQEMQGMAEIITEDIRLLERIFKPIKSILTRPA
ncbi:MAG TPA: HlyD family efflux transporter periplasmic adaptor subunit [Candidatus Deferrimicrobium sp.]|nr:HlyD family efflux transporter periplasmic adaptor subunit [Candidatus Deferrimicrobium sp.]